MLDATFLALQQTIAAIEATRQAPALALADRNVRGLANPAFAALPCDAPAQVWLSAGWQLPVTMVFETTTPVDTQSVTFVSGTAVSAVAAGFGLLGLDAQVDPDNPTRIRLAFGHGPEAFVCVRQLDASLPPLLFSGALTLDGAHELCDQGELVRSAPTGDLDCDGDVDALDLGTLLLAWGTSFAAADLDRSGEVNELDLAILLGAWSPA